jgi:predicted dehydrogenase
VPAWQADVVPIDIALLGCGHPHVLDVLGVLASEPDLRLVAVWDADPSAIPVAVSGAAVSRPETAIGRADAVVICAPTDERPALCVQAARAGRPILVEKPVARTAAEARDVAPPVAHAGRVRLRPISRASGECERRAHARRRDRPVVRRATRVDA